jgi:hypothetical protein
MLFGGSLDSILYPMTADVYYAEESQAQYGNVVKKWIFDRTVKCSAISAISGESISEEIKIKERSITYNSDVFFRTNEDIRKMKNGKYYPIGAVAITNIKDPSGEPAWINTENLKTRAETVKTKYEIRTVVPSFDMFHNIGMYRVFITRSGNQKWEGLE